MGLATSTQRCKITFTFYDEDVKLSDEKDNEFILEYSESSTTTEITNSVTKLMEKIGGMKYAQKESTGEYLNDKNVRIQKILVEAPSPFQANRELAALLNKPDFFMKLAKMKRAGQPIVVSSLEFPFFTAFDEESRNELCIRIAAYSNLFGFKYEQCNYGPHELELVLKANGCMVKK